MEDANEMLYDLKKAREHLDHALIWLKGYDFDGVVESIKDSINVLDAAITDADKPAKHEQDIEAAALTRSYFQDAIGAFYSMKCGSV